jgi:hypothetical protein
MGDWCGIVLEYLQPVKKEITGAKEVSCRIGMVKKRKNKTFFDRGRFSLDKWPFNGWVTP